MRFLSNNSGQDGQVSASLCVQASAPSIILINAQSIIPKIEQLQLAASLKTPHVICLTETWLNESIKSSLVDIPNYHLCRTDRRKRRGGGTAIYVRRDLDFIERTEEYCMEVEFTLIEIRSLKAFLLCVYIPPNLSRVSHEQIHATLVNITDDLLTQKSDYNEIIVGDFNDFLVTDLCDVLALKDLVTKPTRKSNILDHVLVTDGLLRYYESNCISYDAPLANSDHLMISVTPNQCCDAQNFKKVHTLYDFRESHLATLLRAATSFDWANLFNNINEVDEQVALFNESLNNLVKENIPTRTVVITSSDKPWMTPLTKALINDRWSAFRLKQWKL